MKFSECVEIVGSKPSRYQGIKQYVSTGALDSDHIDENSIEEYAYDDRPSRADLVAEAGNVLFAKMAETKKTLVINNQNEKYLFSTGFFAVKPKKNVLTTECLYYLLNSNTFLSQKDKYSSGATQKAISNASLEKIIVNIPCFSKQEDIVKQLDKLSNIIKKTRKQLLNFDLLIKSRFIEMFGDPVENPKQWNIVKLKSLTAKIGSGATPKGGRESYISEGISLVRSMNVYKVFFEYEGLAHITEAQAKELDNVTLQENDVLINITGASVARCCILPKDVLPARVNQHVSILRATEKLNPVYLSNLLISDTEQRVLLGIGGAGGATREAITKTELESLDIPVPPLELQQQFAAFVQQIDKSKFEYTNTGVEA